MPVACKICETNISGNSHSLECTKCKKWIHKKCTGLSSEEYNKTTIEIKKTSFKWVCSPCGISKVRMDSPKVEIQPRISTKGQFTIADVMEKLENIERKYDEVLKMYENQVKVNQELQTEITTLKLQVQKLSTEKDETQAPLEAAREMHDRENRKNNILFFGCSETLLEPATDQVGNLDTQIVNDIIHSVCPEMNLTQLKTYRLGKKTEEKIRPIKVCLNSSKDARAVFFKAKEISKNPTYKHVAIGLDKTPREIAEYKALRAQLTERLNNGEQNLRIKYFRDVPKIIKVCVPEKN